MSLHGEVASHPRHRQHDQCCSARLVKLRRRWKRGMVYKWGSTDEFETCFGVHGHRLPKSGVGWWDTTSQLSTACSQTEAVNT
jgi:hypothetical protein